MRHPSLAAVLPTVLSATLTRSSPGFLSARWAAWNINGSAPRDVFGNWYFGRPGPTRAIQACEYPCNPSCPVFT